jgi:hypothetical protein
MIFNDYLICLRSTQGNTIKRIVQVGRLVSGRFHSGGVSSWTVKLGGVSSQTVKLGGVTSYGKIPFPLMTNGDVDRPILPRGCATS